MRASEPTAVAAIPDDQSADLANQMRLLLAEAAYLWELPARSRDGLLMAGGVSRP